jgi:ATP-dependent helicase/nuclease subunit B
MATLQFILGSASFNHQKAMLDHLTAKIRQAPNDTYLYLVPNHVKFTSEVAVLKGLKTRLGVTGNYAQANVQVLSFSRLGWFLCKDDPDYQKPRLTNIGMTMVVTKIIQELKRENTDLLKMFRGESERQGFATAVTKQLVELQNANIKPEDLAPDKPGGVIQTAKADPKYTQSWQGKMEVLYEIYRRFTAAITTHVTAPDRSAMLLNHIETADLSTTHVYLDRFPSQFSAQEQLIVSALIQNAADTTISLVLDQDYRGRELPAVNNLYYRSAKQYQDLLNLADQQMNVDVLAPLVLNRPDQRRVSDALVAVEEWMDADARFTIPDRLPEATEQVSFFTAPTQVDELNRVATKIRQLVATKNYRYRDFLVVARHLDGYQMMLEPVFRRHQIPVFNDNQRPMATSPLATFTAALFKVASDYYQEADVMELLKTGLLIPETPKELQKEGRSTVNPQTFLNAVYRTENYCLKFGKGGKSWFDERPWQLDRTKEHLKPAELRQQVQINWVKAFVKDSLAPAIEGFKAAQTGRELATKFYQFLVDQGVRHQLYAWARQARDQGEMTQLRDIQQLWQTFGTLLDEYVTILGDQVAPTDQPGGLVKEFSDLMNAGFDAGRYAQIPSTLDQVLVSESGMVQDNQRKVIFIMGATDDVMPEVKVQEGLLSDPDRELLQQGLAPDQFLPISGTDQINNEPFLNYLSMLTATERLYMSAPLMSSDDSELTLSPYLKGLARYFGQWDEQADKLLNDLPAQADPRADEDAVWAFVAAPAVTMGGLIQAERLGKDTGRKLASAWNDVAKALTRKDGTLGGRLNDIRNGKYAKNEAVALPPALAARLYTTDLKTGEVTNQLTASISQLEKYYQNPYDYFLCYGLKLKKRDELEVSSDKSGTLNHDTLAFFVQAVIDDPDLTLADLAKEENQARQDQLIEQAFEQALNQQVELKDLVQNSSQVNLQLKNTKRMLKTMAKVLCLQATQTNARPVAVEKAFGQADWRGEKTGDELTPLTFDLTGAGLAKNAAVSLRGRIDRLDELTIGDVTYQVVVDYKSYDKDFDLVDAYEGVTLQMLAYLNALKNADPAAKLAGCLYLRLYVPEVAAGKEGETTELKNHLYKGLTTNDEFVLLALDHGLLNKGSATLLNIKKKTRSDTGGLKVSDAEHFSTKVGSNMVSKTALKLLMKRNAQLIKEAAAAILQGHNQITPYRRQKGTTTVTGLAFSDYLDVSRFDQAVDQYRDITTTADQVEEAIEPQRQKEEE